MSCLYNVDCSDGLAHATTPDLGDQKFAGCSPFYLAGVRRAVRRYDDYQAWERAKRGRAGAIEVAV